MLGRASTTALGIISTSVHRAIILSATELRVQPVVINVEERTPVSSGYRRERERESEFILPLVQILPSTIDKFTMHFIINIFQKEKFIMLKKCKFDIMDILLEKNRKKRKTTLK